MMAPKAAPITGTVISKPIMTKRKENTFLSLLGPMATPARDVPIKKTGPRAIPLKKRSKR